MSAGLDGVVVVGGRGGVQPCPSHPVTPCMADMLGLPAEAKSLDNTKFLALLAAQMVASLIGINF